MENIVTECNTAFYQHLENGTLKLSNQNDLFDSNLIVPLYYVFIGIAIKKLYYETISKKAILEDNNSKSYYNYRLSRARMEIECAIDYVASSKLRILL